MFLYRAISFPLLLALLAAVVYWPAGGPWIYTFVASGAIAAVLFECCRMVEKCGAPTLPKTTALLGGLLFLGYLASNTLLISGQLETAQFLLKLELLVLVFTAFGGWFLLLFGRERRKELMLRAAVSLGVLVLIGFSMYTVTVVYFNRSVPFGPVPLNVGARQFLFLILVTKAMDTGGYIFGMLSGRWMKNGNHKICPSISPKKSWEGTIGGLLFSVGVSLIFWKIYADAPFCRMPFQNLGTSIWWYITAGVVLGIGSLAGDLTESALKRSAGVKDSGAIIPGMGGVFDVLDSFIYNGVLFIVLGMCKFNG